MHAMQCHFNNTMLTKRLIFISFDLQTWQLQSTNDQAITLTFDRFDIYPSRHSTNGCYDYIEINDGVATERYCGSSIPSTFTSVGTEMTVRFHTSVVNSASGFLAVACCSLSVSTDVSGECHKYLLESSEYLMHLFIIT